MNGCQWNGCLTLPFMFHVTTYTSRSAAVLPLVSCLQAAHFSLADLTVLNTGCCGASLPFSIIGDSGMISGATAAAFEDFLSAASFSKISFRSVGNEEHGSKHPPYRLLWWFTAVTSVAAYLLLMAIRLLFSQSNKPLITCWPHLAIHFCRLWGST